MTRRVRPGDQLNITATEYNRLLAAADALHKNRLPGGGGPRTHMQNAATVRVHNITNETIPIGGVGGFQTPLTDPLKGPVELARFVRDATIKVGKPGADGSTGRVGVAIEPIAEDKVGRVVFDGIAAALVNVKKTWHEYADASLSPSFVLESKPEGSAQILWRRDPSETGVQWAVVRVGHPKDIVYLVKVPPGGITARRGTVTGSGDCDLFQLDETGKIEPVLDVDGEQVRIVARNHSTQRIRGPIDGSGDQYLTVTFDGNQTWVLDPPKQTLLCKPTKRIKAKSWGTARELRYDGSQWRPVGVKVAVYNVCDYALLASQQIICHFHEDTASYLTIGCRCCEGSSSSSSSSSSSNSSSSSSSVSSSDSSDSSESSESSVSLSVSSVGSSSSSASSSGSGSSSDSSGSSESSSASESSDSRSESSASFSNPSKTSSSLSDSSGSHSSSSESDSESSQSESESQSNSGSESGSEPSYSRPSSGSDSYSQSASGSQSGSDSASHSTSTSNSQSTSESQSDSTSDSVSEPSYSRPSTSESGSIIGSDSTSHSLSLSGSTSDSLSASGSKSDSQSESASRSTSDSTSTSGSDRPSHSDDPSLGSSGSGSQPPSESEASTSGSNRPSDSGEKSSDRPSESRSESSEGSDRPSHSVSDSEPPSENSSGSSEPCNSTWIWSCGWELVESDCEEPGEPPTSSGAYDGQVAEMSA